MNVRSPILVGMVLIVAVSGLIWFFVRTGKDTFGDHATHVFYADFDDASGIRLKTRVQINGIDVGKISDIGHVRDVSGRLKARITLRIAQRYSLYRDAQLKKAAESLLGDFRLDLDPGTPGAHELKEGDSIVRVQSLSDIDEIKGQLLKVTRNVGEITQTLSRVLSGPEGEGSLRSIMHRVENSMSAIEETTHALRNTIVGNDEVIAKIIQDVGQVTKALALISKPQGDLLSMSHNVASVTRKLDHMADTVQNLLGETQIDGAQPAQDPTVHTTLRNLGDSIKNLSDITRKIDEGQGTLGRIVNDPGIADRVELTLDSANQIIGSIAGLETQIELRTEYDVPFAGSNTQIQPAIKNTLALRILPKPDKYYIIEAISDPRGKQSRTLTTTAINGETINTDETVIAFNGLKFSAEFAKRYYFATLRFGIIENTGGLGLNFHFANDKGEIRLDAFDFDRRDPTYSRTIFPRLRAAGMYEVVSHISVQGGFDDPFNGQLRTWFLGGVLRFTDEDLKGLLAVAPKP